MPSGSLMMDLLWLPERSAFAGVGRPAPWRSTAPGTALDQAQALDMRVVAPTVAINFAPVGLMTIPTTLGRCRVAARPAIQPQQPDRLTCDWENPVSIGKKEYRFGATLVLEPGAPAVFWFRATRDNNFPDRKVPAIGSAVQAIEDELGPQLAHFVASRPGDARTLIGASLENYLQESADAREHDKLAAVKTQRRKLRYREKALAEAIDEFERERGVTAFVKDRLTVVAPLGSASRIEHLFYNADSVRGRG